MSSLSLFLKVASFEDTDQTNAPRLRAFDWNRNTISGVQIQNPGDSKIVVGPLATKTVFDGSVALSYDGTTQFSVVLSSLSSSLYRMTWTSGTDPVFRTARSLSLTGGTLTFTILANQTAVVTHSADSVFSNIQDGDEIFVPGVSTGDTSLFSALNEGKWLVLAATSTQLTLVRDTGSIFEGTTETKGITSSSQFLAYSSAGVQVGDTLSISSGFTTALRHDFNITKVTSKFIEFESAAPMPAQTVIPGVSSFDVYNMAKSFYYLETDQEIEVSINGNTAETITPFQAGDPAFPGIKMASSTVYSMSVTNKSSQSANVRIITVE